MRKSNVTCWIYFYEPDPKQIAWRKEDARLKKKGVEKKYRPVAPSKDPAYPSKKELALNLLSNFSNTFSEVRVKAVDADTAYGTLDFMEEAAHITKQSQVISQIKKSQLIVVNNKEITVENFLKITKAIQRKYRYAVKKEQLPIAAAYSKLNLIRKNILSLR